VQRVAEAEKRTMRVCGSPVMRVQGPLSLLTMLAVNPTPRKEGLTK
jgi:hypothetical protein